MDLLIEKESVRVSDLSGDFQVSEATIRRDLEALEQQGLLERCHGGAIVGNRIAKESHYAQKQTTFLQAKERIGALAATLVDDDETVIVGAGTTTLQLLKNLSEKRVQIITPNVGWITECRESVATVTLTGGHYRTKSHSLLGPAALLTLQYYNADRCVLGTDGVSMKHGLTTPTEEEAMLLKTILERTRGKAIVLADHSKFGSVASVKWADIGDIDILVTDSLVDANYTRDLESLGVQVIVADYSDTA